MYLSPWYIDRGELGLHLAGAGTMKPKDETRVVPGLIIHNLYHYYWCAIHYVYQIYVYDMVLIYSEPIPFKVWNWDEPVYINLYCICTYLICWVKICHFYSLSCQWLREYNQNYKQNMFALFEKADLINTRSGYKIKVDIKIRFFFLYFLLWLTFYTKKIKTLL